MPSLTTIEKLDIMRCVAIIDPCHKIYATQFMPISLEKILAIYRVKSEGKYPQTVVKTFYGWLIDKV
jgi:hypothetical protein